MRADAVVIGGGFYGSCLAVHLRRRLPRVVLLERETALLQRASRVNQARLHNGYHYPRSFLTAARSHANFATFRREFPDAVESGFTHLYAIARADSKVGHRHFERLFAAIGVTLRAARPRFAGLWNANLVAAVYEVEEPAFNADALRAAVTRQLAEAGVDVRLGAEAEPVEARPGETVGVAVRGGPDIVADWLFNCTYAGLNGAVVTAPESRPALEQQFTEMALITPPDELRDIGVTVMDGPFFSCMPYPPAGLHSLSHVRYTPHLKWIDAATTAHDPREVLRGWHGQSRYAWMIRDAQRYLPALAGSRYEGSLYDIKTLVRGMHGDDARPILFHRDIRNPRIVSILGSKLDNIFDVYQYVDLALDGARSAA